MPPFPNEAGSSGGSSGPYDDLARALAGLPRPRGVRMSRRGKMNATIVAVALAGSLGIFAWGLAVPAAGQARNGAQPQFLTFALPVILIFAIVPMMLSTIGRQKRLLAEGEIAAARVIEKRPGRNGPNVRYEFTTPLGEHLGGIAQDGSRQLAAGMSVPVFYDPQRPKKQLALCASLYEVVMPGDDEAVRGQ